MSAVLRSLSRGICAGSRPRARPPRREPVAESQHKYRVEQAQNCRHFCSLLIEEIYPKFIS